MMFRTRQKIWTPPKDLKPSEIFWWIFVMRKSFSRVLFVKGTRFTSTNHKVFALKSRNRIGRFRSFVFLILPRFLGLSRPSGGSGDSPSPMFRISLQRSPYLSVYDLWFQVYEFEDSVSEAFLERRASSSCFCIAATVS
jgi:hypothetical protein